MKRILAHTHKKNKKENEKKKDFGEEKKKKHRWGEVGTVFFNAEAIRCCVCAITKEKEDDGQAVVAAGK